MRGFARVAPRLTEESPQRPTPTARHWSVRRGGAAWYPFKHAVPTSRGRGRPQVLECWPPRIRAIRRTSRRLLSPDQRAAGERGEDAPAA